MRTLEYHIPSCLVFSIQAAVYDVDPVIVTFLPCRPSLLKREQKVGGMQRTRYLSPVNTSVQRLTLFSFPLIPLQSVVISPSGEKGWRLED